MVSLIARILRLAWRVAAAAALAVPLAALAADSDDAPKTNPAAKAPASAEAEKPAAPGRGAKYPPERRMPSTFKPATGPGPNSPAILAAADDALPYVYTKWRRLTVQDGLPNDHVFCVKADGNKIWIGTEDGLGCYDKKTGKVRSWKEKDGLPFQAITAIDVDPKTGDVWLGLFGGGLSRFSGGRFDHFHQLNSGLVNDVVYGVAVENDNIWAATTAGASRYNTKTGEWSIFTEKNSPMEEIWNYSVSYDQGKVYLGVWGSGCLEYDVKTGRWKPYLDPDGQMEIDLYRDDGIVHVIVTGASHAEDSLWISTYFGNCRYDGRHWRGFYAHETGMPSDFTNGVKGRSSREAWFAHDKGVGVVADFPTDTYVAYTRDLETLRGKAQVFRKGKLLKTYEMEVGLPQNFTIGVEFDGNDVWVATGKGLGWAIGDGYYTGVRRPGEKPSAASGDARSTRPPAVPPSK
jgi:ligand-binding sensor domain-containing protein